MLYHSGSSTGPCKRLPHLLLPHAAQSCCNSSSCQASTERLKDRPLQVIASPAVASGSAVLLPSSQVEACCAQGVRPRLAGQELCCWEPAAAPAPCRPVTRAARHLPFRIYNPCKLAPACLSALQPCRSGNRKVRAFSQDLWSPKTQSSTPVSPTAMPMHQSPI